MTILPCPWCGAVPEYDNPDSYQYVDGSSKYGAVVCCGTGPEVRTGYNLWRDWRDAAIAAWNTRVVK